ncbi:MAG: beta-eliminating lyase-related protein, partial [Pseudomonadota bacterium]
MQFRSDNTGPAHPKVLEAILAANAGYTAPYGDETAMEAVRARLREIFEAPEAAVYLVATGTAANALLLSTMTQPWQRVFCGTLSHVLIDECGAVEHATGGARLEPVAGPDAKIGIAEFEAALAAVDPADIHMTQRGPVTITQVTERGTLYTLDEIRAIANLAHAHGSGVHMDGARFANALVALGCTPAEMTWKAGVDAVSFGATKNGCLGVEAAILFNPAKAREFELRRKRAAHLFSKHRYLSAQMAAYLQDDLWLDLARQSNAA